MTGRRRLLRALLLALSIAGIVALTKQLPPMQCADVREAAEGEFRPWLILSGALLIYIAAPRWMVIAALGVAFGAWWGFWFATLAAWVASLGAFWTTRTVLREVIAARLSHRAWFTSLESAMRGGGGFKISFLLRLNPLVHFTISSWALGLTAVSFGSYALGTLLGMIPMSAVFAYAGETVGCALLDKAPLPPASKLGLFLSLAALTVVSLIPFLVSWLRKRRLAT